MVDQELSDLGVRASRRRARRRAAGQGANRAGRPGETDAVRHLFVLRLGDAKPSRVALTELRNERPHLRRFRRSGERGVLVLQGILLGRAVIPLNLHVSVAEGGSGQCLELSGFSCQGLIDQLSSEFGDKYTVEQATYGATQAGIC